jgi:hypothetical protein
VEWFAGLSELPSVPGLVVMELIQNADNEDRVRKALKLVEALPSSDRPLNGSAV